MVVQSNSKTIYVWRGEPSDAKAPACAAHPLSYLMYRECSSPHGLDHKFHFSYMSNQEKDILLSLKGKPYLL
jgi:hypothetical protein